VQDARFLQNAALDGVSYSNGGGLACVAETTQAHVATTSFDGNVAKGGPHASGQGGGISVLQATLLLGERVRFLGNIAAGDGSKPSGGGALSVAEFPAVLLADEATEFVQNVAEGAAPKGGALLVIDSPKTVRFKGADFGANTVRALSGTGCGGAVSVDLGGDVRLDSCELHDNTALMASDMAHGASGGAICVGLNGRAWLVAGKMRSNQAGGGAPVHLLKRHSSRQSCRT
jgi:hypothetical protein